MAVVAVDAHGDSTIGLERNRILRRIIRGQDITIGAFELHQLPRCAFEIAPSPPLIFITDGLLTLRQERGVPTVLDVHITPTRHDLNRAIYVSNFKLRPVCRRWR